MSEVAVVLPAHNAADHIDDQLAALASQRFDGAVEIVVVCNRCTDDTRKVAGRWVGQLPGLRVIEANERASAGYARNRGVEATRSPLLLFCDADDVVDGGWIAGMVQGFDVGDVVTGWLEDDVSSAPSWLARIARYHPEARPGLALYADRIWYAPTASLGTRRDLFMGVGGFDETFAGASSEDMLLVRSLLRRSARLAVSDAARVRYNPRTSLSSWLEQQRTYDRARNRLLAGEGELAGVPPFSTEVRRSIRRHGSMLIRGHEFHPLVHAATAKRTVDRRRAMQGAAPFIRPLEPTTEAVLPPSVPLVGGRLFDCHRATARWWARGGGEELHLRALERFLPRGGYAIDVGANIGVITVACALQVGSSGRVVSIEPDAGSRRLLEQNIARHNVTSIVDVMAAAAGHHAGEAQLVRGDNDLLHRATSRPAEMVEGSPVVPMVRLDDLQLARLDLVKVDVEGEELSVLEGAQQFLAAHPNAVIICELNPAALRRAGRSAGELIDALRSCRTQVSALVDTGARDVDGNLVDPTTLPTGLLEGTDDAWYTNLIAYSP